MNTVRIPFLSLMTRFWGLILISTGCLLLCPLQGQGLIDPDPRWEYPHFLGFRPADGREVAVNPPRFSWHYRPGIIGAQNDSLKQFTFQVDNDSGFGSPEVNVVVDYNFYNALAPFAAGTWYWRVGYDNDSNGSVDQWSATRSFIVTGSEVQWNRSAQANAEATLAAMPRPRFGPVGGDWAAFKTFLESTSEGQDWLNQLKARADIYIAQNWYQNTAYFPTTDVDGADGTIDRLATFSTPGGTVSWYTDDFGRTAQNAALVAFTYKVTGDPAYAGAKDVLLRFAGFPHSSSSLSWPEFNGGATKQSVCIIEYLSLLYDWFYDDLSSSERALIIDRVSLRLEQVFTVDRTWRSSADAYHEGIAITGTSHAYQNFMWALPGLLLMTGEDSNLDNLDLVPLALDFLTGVTASSLYGPDDGAINEGVGYGGEKIGTTLRSALMAEIMLDLGQEKNPFFEGYQRWYSHIMPSGYDRIPFGDQWEYELEGQQLYNQRALTLMTGNPLAKQRWTSEVLDQGNLLEIYTFSRPWTILLAEQHLASNAAVSPQVENINEMFPESGWVFAGNAPPTRDAEVNSGVRMSFHSRPRGGRSHSFRSENAFAWYAYGETLAAGGGSRRFPDPYGRHTMSHNAILIDGIGQEWKTNDSIPSEPYIGRLLAYEEGSFDGSGSYTHWVGDATKAYQTLAGPGLKRWHRHVILVDEKYFIVYDDLQLNDGAAPATFSWLMSVDQDVAITSGANEFSWSQESVNARVFFARDPGDLTITKQSGVEEMYRNLRTGENMLPAVEQNFTNLGRDYWSEYPDAERTHNKLWVENKEVNTRWQLMTALLAWPNGTTAPTANRMDDRTLQITFDGQTRTISFDPTQTADYVVDLNTYRLHAGESVPDKPTVSVTRSTTEMVENSGQEQAFYINRSDQYDSTVTVHYTVSGTAANGVDHSLDASGSVVIPADQSLARIPFTLNDDSHVESNETIVLTVTPDPTTYTIGQASADITILDDDTIDLFAVDARVAPGSTTQLSFNITNTSGASQTYTLSTQDESSGYRWNSSGNDNNEAFVPSYSWVELKEFTGAQTASFSGDFNGLDDGESASLPIGFSFPYYDSSSSTIKVNTNGFAYLGANNGTTLDHSNQALPYASADKGSIFPLWDDLIFRDGSQLYYAQVDNDTFVLQWDYVGFYRKAHSQRVSFQAVLYRDGSIQFNYKDNNPDPNSNFSYTVGIQNFDNSEALQIAHFDATTDGNLIPKGSNVDYAIRIWRPSDFITLSDSTFTLAAGGSKQITLTLDANNLILGEYINNLNITGSNEGALRDIPVTLEVSDHIPLSSAPASLSLSNAAREQVRLSWPDATGETGYRIWMRKAGETTWIMLSDSTPADSTSFEVTGLVEDQSYDFHVEALGMTEPVAGASGSIHTTGPDLILYENFEGISSPLANQATSDGNGTWGHFRDDALPGEGQLESGSVSFAASDNPFGTSGGNCALHRIGLDSTLRFPPAPAGGDLYFSFNYKFIGIDATTHTISFYTEHPTDTPFLSIQMPQNSSDPTKRDFSIRAQNNIQSAVGVLSENTGYVIYGKISTSADLVTWTISANITDDPGTIPAVESWDFSQSHSYGSARSSHSNRISFDSAGGTTTGRYYVDDIRMSTNYPDVISAGPELNAVQQWRSMHFGTYASYADTGDQAMPGGDGMSNLMKFALGGTPWTPPGQLMPVPSIARVGPDSYLGLRYRRRTGGGTGSTVTGYTVDGVTYTVETSPSLTNQEWNTGSGYIQEVMVNPAGEGLDEVTVRSANPASGQPLEFMRLRVEPASP